MKCYELWVCRCQTGTMQISNLSLCVQVWQHKLRLLQRPRSANAVGAGVEREGTDGVRIAAGVVREDTREDRVQEMETKTDDTGRDGTITIADIVLQMMSANADTTTVVVSAQGQDRSNAEGTGVDRRAERETEMASGADVTTKRQL